MKITEFKVVKSKAVFGVAGSVTANVMQWFEQDYRFNHNDSEVEAHISVFPNRAIFTYSFEDLDDESIKEVLGLLPVLKDKKWETFTTQKYPVAEYYKTEVVIDFL